MNKIPTETILKSNVAKLKNTSILEVKGADALSFLQGQLSQNISLININNAMMASMSSPKGRLMAICHVYRASEEIFWLFLPIGIIENIQAHLTKYVMRSKVIISKRDDLPIFGCLNDQSLKFEHSFKLNQHCDLAIGITIVNGAESNYLSEDNWNRQKVVNGIPDIFAQTQEHFVAQMLNLDLLDGISFNKGCYTGQEIIARMQHLGRIKRRMLLVELDKELAIGEKLIIDEVSLGEIVNISIDADSILALVCVQLDKLNKSSVPLNIKPYKYPIPELTG